jgi:hypothetical protein
MGGSHSVQYVPYYVPSAPTVQTRIQYVDREVIKNVPVAPNAINITLPKERVATGPPVNTGIPCTPDKKCMSDLASRLKDLIQEVATLQSNITDSFQIVISNQVGYKGETYFKKKVRDYNDKKAMYNRLFQEAEARNQRKGGKTRKQTLQEYVILLFYISYFVLTISYAFYSSVIVGQSAYGALGFMFAMIVPITVFLVYVL